MASVDFNYHALRAQQARFGRILSSVVARLLPWLSGLLWLLGIVLLIVERLSVGWLACALGCMAVMIIFGWNSREGAHCRLPSFRFIPGPGLSIGDPG